MHELILLRSKQCTNPGPSFSCSICHRQYIKSQYSYRCSSCKSWVHQKCSELTNYSHFTIIYGSAPDARQLLPKRKPTLPLLFLPPFIPNSPPVPFYSSTVMAPYTACRNYLPFSSRKTSL